jgi:electron transport complex protein RnfD
MTQPALHVTASPHIRAADDTPTIMWSVVMSLVPVVGASIYFFGPSALLVILASCAGVLVVERFFGVSRGKSLFDGSAVITGVLLGLTLPPGFPLWMAFLGGAFGMAFGKLIFGGLGQNVFNPALLGRAFLQAAFPVAITTWSAQPERWISLRGDNFAFPLMSPTLADGMTGATPLGLMKFEQTSTELFDLFWGSTGGSVGETSALFILMGGIYLALRNHLNWRIPVSIFVTVAVFSGAVQLYDSSSPGPLFMLCSGGLMLGAVYMATDMVTSPVTNLGSWVFGFGIGFLVVVIRLWGGLPEGVMYSILLMNALVPFINRATQPRVFGTGTVRGKGASS